MMGMRVFIWLPMHLKQYIYIDIYKYFLIYLFEGIFQINQVSNEKKKTNKRPNEQ